MIANRQKLARAQAAIDYVERYSVPQKSMSGIEISSNEKLILSVVGVSALAVILLYWKE